jgi:hypothetical protein
VPPRRLEVEQADRPLRLRRLVEPQRVLVRPEPVPEQPDVGPFPLQQLVQAAPDQLPVDLLHRRRVVREQELEQGVRPPVGQCEEPFFEGEPRGVVVGNGERVDRSLKKESAAPRRTAVQATFE